MKGVLGMHVHNGMATKTLIGGLCLWLGGCDLLSDGGGGSSAVVTDQDVVSSYVAYRNVDEHDDSKFTIVTKGISNGRYEIFYNVQFDNSDISYGRTSHFAKLEVFRDVRPLHSEYVELSGVTGISSGGGHGGQGPIGQSWGGYRMNVTNAITAGAYHFFLTIRAGVVSEEYDQNLNPLPSRSHAIKKTFYLRWPDDFVEETTKPQANG